jgi:hypothetical protein
MWDLMVLMYVSVSHSEGIITQSSDGLLSQKL